jgi:hypothetical protein
VNAAQQLGGTLGLSILITVFTAALRTGTSQTGAGASPAAQLRDALAHGVASSITGAAVLLVLGVLVVTLTALPGRAPSAVAVTEAA